MSRRILAGATLVALGGLALMASALVEAAMYRCQSRDGLVTFTSQLIVDAACREIGTSESGGAAAPAVISEPAASPRPPVPAKPARRTAARPIPPESVLPVPQAPGTRPEFINERANRLEFMERAQFAPFQDKWHDPGRGPISIAHLGDSHVHNGHAVEVIRQRLQALRGDGGRGMVFPYAIAGTYSQNDFTSWFEGKWVYSNSVMVRPRVPVGVSGFVAQTHEPRASFAIQFKTPPDPGPKRVRVFLRAGDAGYRLIASSNRLTYSLDLDGPIRTGESVAEYDFRSISDTLRFDLLNLSQAAGGQQAGGGFELHGISIENVNPGLIYHNLGVGGASFTALENQILFAQQTRFLGADLFVLDWGTNDIAIRNAVPEQHAQTVVRAIRKIREIAPHAVIVLTSVQDMDYQGRNVSAAGQYADRMRALARENRCVFYDWYRVAGGAGSMRHWFAAGLAGSDRLHLSPRGYQLRGELFASALLQAVGSVPGARR